MEINQLRAFITVAREKNLSRAAKILHITQPALSMQIKMLENELGFLLFDRNSRGMELSEYGAQLLAGAVQILDGIESFQSKAQMLRRDPSGSISLGINASINVLKVDALISVLSADFPQIEIHLLQSTSREIKEHIRKRTMDCGFIFGEHGDSDMAWLKLCEMNLCVVAHPEWKRLAITKDLKKLENKTWIMRSAQCPFYGALTGFFRELNMKPARMIFANQDPVVYDLIQAEKGVSLLLEADALALQKTKQVVIMPHDPLKVSLAFAYLENRPANPALQIILDTIKQIWDSTAAALPHS